jgi:hypothetical protein
MQAINPSRTEDYFCHQNQNAKNIGNFTTLLKPHNIGTHLKGIETSFQVVPLFLKSFHFWVSYITAEDVMVLPCDFDFTAVCHDSNTKESTRQSFFNFQENLNEDK